MDYGCMLVNTINLFFIDSMAIMPQTTTTELLATTLKPHQREGLRKARLALQAHGGVLIADEMGLGKTLVALYLLLRGARVATQSGGVARMLVVVPSAVQLVWLDEFAKHIRRTALLRTTHSTTPPR